jgi:hypothetical protein
MTARAVVPPVGREDSGETRLGKRKRKALGKEKKKGVREREKERRSQVNGSAKKGTA